MRWCGGISLLQWCEDINWTLVSLFLLSWQDGIWMPYSKRALSLLSELNKELNLFNNAWAFTLTQHFLPFFSCTTFSILARGFLMTLHEDSQCMRWTSPTVRWPMFMEALPRLGIFFFFCDVMSCLQCAFNVSFDMCHCSPGPCLKRVFWQKPVNGQRGGSCSVSLMKALPVRRWGF